MALEHRRQLGSHDMPRYSKKSTERVVVLLAMILLGCWGQVAAADPVILNLWPDRPPGETQELPPEADQTKTDDKLIGGRRIIKLGNVSTPQITVYRPAPAKDTGAAVVVCPGGGHHILAYDLEGTEVADWLTSIGVTGIVLKYRVPFRDPDQRWLAAVQDAQRAMSIVRSKACEWGIDSQRIGICGFSAGGETAGLTSLLTERQYDALDEIDQQPFRPDFALLVYPGGFTAKDGDSLREYITVPDNAPPVFFVHAFDDRVTMQNSLLLASALKAAGGSAELHLFTTGGHGYGLRPTSEAITRWPVRAAEWMRERRFLDRKDNTQSGHPADHLPPPIRQISHYGERVEFSHDGQRLLFLNKQFGDVMEYDIASGVTRCLSQHFQHHGFNRCFYLSNGDILLTGPDKPFDTTDRQSRLHARHHAKMFVLRRSLDSQPVPLGVVAAEGPAVSRTSLKVAWTHHIEGQSRQAAISMGEIDYQDGTPKLVNTRQILTAGAFPEGQRPKMIETQNFVGLDDRQITVTAYLIENGHNTEGYLFDLETGRLTNFTNTPDHYEEVEGIFPDGLSTTVERNGSVGKPWPLVDGWRVWFDGSREPQRLTYFLEFPGYKASNYTVSDDGRWMAFQIGKAGDEAGVGYGIFLMDLTQGELAE